MNTKSSLPPEDQFLAELWSRACIHDGIDPKSKFVVFSDDNPWVLLHGAASRALGKDGG